MEKNKTQRIVGTLVIIAVVIILLPLLFGRNDISAQTAAVKAPPFPDQANTSDNQKIQISPELAENLSSIGIGTDLPDANVDVMGRTATGQPQLSSTQLASNSPSVVVTQEKIAETPAQPEVIPNKVATTPEQKTAPLEKSKPAVLNAKTIRDSIVKPILTRTAHNDQPLKKLKGSAWVVQMGSFKNKVNAQRLVDKLRGQGYKAFTRKTGDAVRVFIGPEYQEASATKLSTKIAQQTNLRGIIMKYKPLAL